MKKWLLTFAFFCLICFVGCEKKEEKIIKIGVLRTADSVPLYVAEEDELFEKYGVHVDLIEFSSASDQSKAIEAGAVDGLMTELILQSLIKKGGCDLKSVIVALGGEASDGQVMVVAAENSPFADSETIEGARVAIAEGTLMEFLLDSYCEELGLNLDSIEKVSVPSLSLRLEMLIEGNDIDCAVLPEPLAQFAVLQGGKAKIDDTKLDATLSLSVIALSDQFIEKNPDIVSKFVKACTEAAEHLNKEPERYKDLVLNVANVPEAMKDNYKIPYYSEGILPEKELVERVENWMLKKGLLNKAFSYEELIDDSFVKSAE